MEKFASDFAASLLKADSQPLTAALIGLSGDLGSGKTAFVKGVAKALGVKEEVTSPTFVIEKFFAIDHPPFTRLIHIDAYRIEHSSELASLRWKETVADPKNLIFIEWPEKIADILPKGMQMLTFKFIDETTREISYS